jgi:hypothetical protein
MKGILLIILAIAAPILLAPASAFGQNSTNATVDNSSNTGGLSSESVKLAESNATNSATNSPNPENKTGGLSSESVKLAESNATNSATNSPNPENKTGGLSSESVMESRD